MHWLYGRLPEAMERADDAQALFDKAADPVGLADTHYLKALLHADLGLIDKRTAMITAAAGFASRGNDGMRVAFFRARPRPLGCD